MTPPPPTLHICLSFLSALLLLCTTTWGAVPGSVEDDQRQPVTIQLRWYHQFQFAGYYAAIEKGYYRDAGLDVRVVEGGKGVNTVEEVLAGKADFGVTNSELLVHRLQGKPLVVLAAIFQHSPLVILTRQDAGIYTPQDLVDKNVILSRGSRDLELHAMLQAEGIGLEQLNLLDRVTSPRDYLDPDIDALSAYLTNQPFYMRQANIAYHLLRPAAYGIDFYGDCLFTSEAVRDNDPKMVAAFRQASLKGWEYAMANSEEIIDLILKSYAPHKNRGHLRYEAESMIQLIMPELVEMGHMNPGRWQHIAQVYARYQIIEKDGDLSGFLYDPNEVNVVPKQTALLMLGSIFGLILMVMALMVFTQRLQREVAERRASETALVESQNQVILYSRQLEQASLAASAILATGIDRDIFDHLCGTIRENLDYGRIAISIFREDQPQRELLACSGLLPEEEERLRSFTITRDILREVFRKAQPVGQSSYYLSHQQETLLPQGHFLPGKGVALPTEDSWHPKDNLLVKIKGKEGEFIGYITADECKSGKKPTAESVRPLEIFADLIAQAFLVHREYQVRQSLEQQLQRASKMEAIGQLAGGVAHDLNNILSGIMTLPQLLLVDMQPDNPLYSKLKLIQQSGERAAAIVQDLLTLSRRGVTITTVTNVQDILKDYLATPEYRQIVERHPDVRVTLHCPIRPPNIKGSPFHLIKAMANLVQNSAEAMPKGGEIVITASAGRTVVTGLPANDTGWVMLQVKDNGVGISADDIEHIFEPFYTKKHMGFSGTGLGMTVVAGTVKDHEGTIEVESTAEGGTCISMFFPATSDLLEAEGQEAQACQLSGNGEIVLVVDDIIEQRQIAAALLTKLGYRVETAASGEEAIRYLENHPVDLVMLDMLMEPGINGLETFIRMRQVKPDQKAIIATGFSDPSLISEAEQRGILAVIQKPYSIGRLRSIIQTALHLERRAGTEQP